MQPGKPWECFKSGRSTIYIFKEKRNSSYPHTFEMPQISLDAFESYSNMDRKMLVKTQSNAAFRRIIFLLLVCQVN